MTKDDREGNIMSLAIAFGTCIAKAEAKGGIKENINCSFETWW